MPVEFPSKIQISKNCLKLSRTLLLMMEKILPKNIFLPHFKIVQNFHYFCKDACRIPVKNSIFQKMPKIVEKHFFWWMEQIILCTKIFTIAHFKIVQNFHYFCKVRACRISVKNSNFQKLPKIWRNTSFKEWNK